MSGALVVAAAIASPIAGAMPATATTRATITVTPSTGLRSGQIVTVAGSGFSSGASVRVGQCSNGGENSLLDCDIANSITVSPADDGTFTTPFTIETGTVGDGTCESGSTDCGIAAVNTDNTNQLATQSVQIGPVVTVTPQTGLVNGQAVTVSGVGFPGKLGQTVSVYQCASAHGAGTCRSATAGTAVLSDSGQFTARVKVATGSTGSGSCAGGSTCYLLASDKGTTSAAASDAAVVSIVFHPTTKVATTTTAKASKRRVPPAKKFTISGTVKAAGKGVRGLTVTLYDSANGRKWTKVKGGVLTTKAGGAFTSAKLKGPKRTLQYEVRTAARTIGLRDYRASTSKVITVKK
jgi:hypothetical protein